MTLLEKFQSKITGWRTIIVNGAGIVIPVLKFAYPDADLPGTEDISLVVEQTFAGTVLLWSSINLVLRWFTKGPIGAKPDVPKG